ncbi:MAG: hypothetical protein FWD73_03030 [Polyangiaceae bacterium]|nr:hypothetical protein [Polyangiaceae bacterium]
MKRVTFIAVGLFAMATACGGGAATTEPPKTGHSVATPGGGTAPVEVKKDAQAKFNTAIDAFVEHDRVNDWNDANCSAVAKQFEEATVAQGGRFAQAAFNAGLAYQRCNDDKNARARFEQALKDDPRFHNARAQLALYQYKQDGNEDLAIASLQQAVIDAQFQNVVALVNLAMFQMQRDSDVAGQRCKNDFDCAKLNLQRALAIDDAYMPAFNQLALYYFQLAKKRAGAVRSTTRGSRGRQVTTNAAMARRADVQQLELAALVSSQAIRKNPNYAPIHNTAGLIQNELGQVNGAVSSFATAAKLDPKLFEAQMNYGAVNLGFRGFEQAKNAYARALQLRSNDYDAHLGMALALRGPITGSEPDAEALVAAAQAELDAAKRIDPNRPDAYFNEGILTMEFKAKAGGSKEKTIAALDHAAAVFKIFLEKAAGKPEYDGAVRRVRGDGTDKDRGRLGDIEDTKQFLNTEAPMTPSGAPSGVKP